MKRAIHFRIVSALVAALCLLAAPAAPDAPAGKPVQPVEVRMRNVMYHYPGDVAVHIRTLEGRLEPTQGAIPTFEDKDSFSLAIGSAEIAMSADSLANDLNSYVFAQPDAPLKDVSLQVHGDRLQVKGKLHSKGDLPFEAEGQLSATPDGRIRLHADKMRALHLPMKGLFDLLGIKISNLVKTGKMQGLQAEKDDLIFDPGALLPPPRIRGQITAVRLEGNNIVQVFGHPAAAPRLPYANYMAYRGSQLRFGKLTMRDTDMVLVDMDPRDPFDFYLDHYKEQLVAGYTKETPSFGLRVFMRDYDKLPQARAAGKRTGGAAAR